MRRCGFSGLDDWGEIAGSDGAGEVDAFVGAVAEGSVCGLAAAAEGDGGAPTEAEGVAGLVDDFEVAFDTDGAVVEDCHASAGHECLRRMCWVRRQDSEGRRKCKREEESCQLAVYRDAKTLGLRSFASLRMTTNCWFGPSTTIDSVTATPFW